MEDAGVILFAVGLALIVSEMGGNLTAKWQGITLSGKAGSVMVILGLIMWLGIGG